MPAAAALPANELRGGLTVDRRRDRPAVVDAEQDHRGADDAGEVGGLVEVALGGGAVAEVAEHHPVLATQPHPPGEPDGVGDLCGDRDLGREDVHPGRIPPRVGVAGVIEDGVAEHVGAEAAEADRLAVLGHRPVDGRVHRRRRADHRRLLAVDRRRGADAALPLQVEQARRPVARPGHLRQELAQRRRVLRIRAHRRGGRSRVRHPPPSLDEVDEVGVLQRVLDLVLERLDVVEGPHHLRVVGAVGLGDQGLPVGTEQARLDDVLVQAVAVPELQKVWYPR